MQYDMLTTPITNDAFQTRVLATISDHMDALRSKNDEEIALPTITPLSKIDTPLAPGDTVTQLLAVASPWIDLCSPDPLIFNISRQVLELEIAYAAYCGIGNIVLQGPKLHHGNVHEEGVAQYAYAVQEALSLSNYIQVHLWVPIVDEPQPDSKSAVVSISNLARVEYVGSSMEEQTDTVDNFGTWDAWNLVRSVCRYNARLFVGKSDIQLLASLSKPWV